MSYAEEYLATVRDQIDAVGESQRDQIAAAGQYFADVLCRGGWIYVFGTGHSHMIAEELFYRAGGLSRIRPILISPLMLHESACESTALERDPRMVDQILEEYPIQSEDVLLIASNSGRNPVPVELAKRVQQRKTPVIALLNRRHSASVESRHESGLKLGDLADLVIDNCGVEGDACVALSEGSGKIGAASTVTGALIVQMIACHAVERATKAGWKPEVFSSSNAAGGEGNDAILERYRGRVRHL